MSALCRQPVCIRTRHHAPRTNAVIDCFVQTLVNEHTYQCEIELVVVLAERVESFLLTFDGVRPHESLGQGIPILTRDTPCPSEGIDTLALACKASRDDCACKAAWFDAFRQQEVVIALDADMIHNLSEASSSALRRLLSVSARVREPRVRGRVWYHTLATSGGLPRRLHS